MKAPTWGEMMADITLTMTIKPENQRLWNIRLEIGTWLICLAAWIMGFGGVEVKE